MNTAEKVTRCRCGHVLEWHYRVGKGGMPMFGKSNHPNRCADWTCDCTNATHDGGEAERLPTVHTSPPLLGVA